LHGRLESIHDKTANLSPKSIPCRAALHSNLTALSRDILNVDEPSKEKAPAAKSPDVAKGLASMSKGMPRANATNIREKKIRGLRNVCRDESNNETESEVRAGIRLERNTRTFRRRMHNPRL
jgi:hypothetical protein